MSLTDTCSLTTESWAKQLTTNISSWSQLLCVLMPPMTGAKMAWVKWTSWGDQLYWITDTVGLSRTCQTEIPVHFFAQQKPQEPFWKGRELNCLRLPIFQVSKPQNKIPEVPESHYVLHRRQALSSKWLLICLETSIVCTLTKNRINTGQESPL